MSRAPTTRRVHTRTGHGPFADVARLAAGVCGTPFAFLQLGAPRNSHLTSGYGIEAGEIPALYHGADDLSSLLLVPDARSNAELSSHPVVTGAPWVRAIAGARVAVPGGATIGRLYAADTIVREFTSEQLGLLCDVARQLSLRLRHDEELARWDDTRRLMDGVFTHSDIAIYSNDLDGKVLLANPAAHQMFGRERGQLVGERVADLLSPESADDFCEHDAYVAGRGRRRLFAERSMHADGSEHAYLATKFPLVDDAGKLYAVAGISTDVTELFEARMALAATEERWRALVDCAPVAVLVVDTAEGRVRYANRQAASLCGMALAADVVGRELADFIPSHGVRGLRQLMANARDVPLRNAPLQLAPLDGAVLDVSLNAVAVTFHDRPAIQLALQDVTAERAIHKELVESSSFQQAILAASPDVIYVMRTSDWQPVWASGDLLHALGYPEQEQSAEPEALLSDQIVHPEDRERLKAMNEATLGLSDGQATQLRFRCRTEAGDYRWFTRRLTPFARNDDGEIVQTLAVARDITDAVDAEERLARAALHDPLTGLPNRVLLADRLTSALHRAERAGTEVAVLFCDLDGFKHVNEVSGHAAGDEVLLVTAGRLNAQLRPQDTIARVGGDEFVIILEPAARSVPGGFTAPADLPEARVDALAVASRIKQVLAEPIEFGEHEHVVTASIGITFARRGEGAEDALRDADSAMYRAKALGKDRCEIFDKHLRIEAVERGRLEQLLRGALAKKIAPNPDRDRTPLKALRQGAGELWVEYQPIIDLATGSVEGVEALARLSSCDGRRVSPEDFIPIAEETGLIGPLGTFVLEQACQDLASWQRTLAAPLGVSVNLSARQAGLPGLVEQVQATLLASQIVPGQLTLELTETALLEAGQATMSALHALRALGVLISIDDFGTGYASLRYLTQLPVSGVKVDRSFTMGLPDDPASNAIVQSVAGLARELSLSCVVEGIETVEQLNALPSGVRGQGYLLGMPIPAAEMGEFLLAQQAAKKCPRQESNLRPST